MERYTDSARFARDLDNYITRSDELDDYCDIMGQPCGKLEVCKVYTDGKCPYC